MSHVGLTFIWGPTVQHSLRCMEKSFTNQEMGELSCCLGISCQSIGQPEISRRRIFPYTSWVHFPCNTSGLVWDHWRRNCSVKALFFCNTASLRVLRARHIKQYIETTCYAKKEKFHPIIISAVKDTPKQKLTATPWIEENGKNTIFTPAWNPS